LYFYKCNNEDKILYIFIFPTNLEVTLVTPKNSKRTLITYIEEYLIFEEEKIYKFLDFLNNFNLVVIKLE